MPWKYVLPKGRIHDTATGKTETPELTEAEKRLRDVQDAAAKRLLGTAGGLVKKVIDRSGPQPNAAGSTPTQTPQLPPNAPVTQTPRGAGGTGVRPRRIVLAPAPVEEDRSQEARPSPATPASTPKKRNRLAGLRSILPLGSKKIVLTGGGIASKWELWNDKDGFSLRLKGYPQLAGDFIRRGYEVQLTPDRSNFVVWGPAKDVPFKSEKEASDSLRAVAGVR